MIAWMVQTRKTVVSKTYLTIPRKARLFIMSSCLLVRSASPCVFCVLLQHSFPFSLWRLSQKILPWSLNTLWKGYYPYGFVKIRKCVWKIRSFAFLFSSPHWRRLIEDTFGKQRGEGRVGFRILPLLCARRLL